jgi:hypothetical protein
LTVPFSVELKWCVSGYRSYKLARIGEIAVAEQNPKLYILDRHNEI